MEHPVQHITKGDSSETVKQKFAEWARDNYRLRKPDFEKEVYEDGKESPEKIAAYQSATPLLKDAAPEFLDALISNFNKCIDMYDAYYAQPKWKQWGLEKRTSAALTNFHRELIPLSKELPQDYRFEAERMWGTVYWSSCLCYRQAHGLNPRVSKDNVNVR